MKSDKEEAKLLSKSMAGDFESIHDVPCPANAKPSKKHWSEDPNTELECDKCESTWKLGESIGCPKCDGKDGGLK